MLYKKSKVSSQKIKLILYLPLKLHIKVSRGHRTIRAQDSSITYTTAPSITSPNFAHSSHRCPVGVFHHALPAPVNNSEKRPPCGFGAKQPCTATGNLPGSAALKRLNARLSSGISRHAPLLSTHRRLFQHEKTH